MNTLFTRTLLWFIATVFATFFALMVVASIDTDPDDRRQSNFALLLDLQLADAIDAWKSGGREQLRSTLDRMNSMTGNRAILTDSTGIDLVTGAVRTDLTQRRPNRAWLIRLHTGHIVSSRRSADGQYMLYYIDEHGNVGRWTLSHVAVLFVLALLSYFFARNLTYPVGQLQRAVEHFGRGDFTSRVRSKRRDEIGQLAQTFDRMADRIETLLAAERRLLLDISHELRSPLARLSLAAELARSSPDPSRYIERIEKEAGRLNDLVGELLQMTRAEGDESRMRREPVSIDGLVASVADDVQIEAQTRGCHIEWGPREEITSEGDAELLRRSFENVIRNAVRYTDPGTAVIVSVQREGHEAIIRVRDHGPGVPEEHLPRIFDPFYRVDPDRNRVSGGVGLGLAIARRAIELHSGRITARNANPGLLVEIHLPLS